MLHLDDRTAQVYADMHADLEAARVGHRVPVYRPGPSRLDRWSLRLQNFFRRAAGSRRERAVEQRARPAHPQEQCC